MTKLRVKRTSFKSLVHVSCVTMHNIPVCGEDESRKLGRVDKSNCYCNDESHGVRGIINEADAMDGSTAPIEGQGLNVQSQHGNRKSVG